GGTVNGKPFLRYYGPDLTGLFIGDAGALGYKAEVTFRLMPAPAHEDWASFDFEDRDAWAAAVADMQREDIAAEIFGFDPNLTRLRMARASLISDAKALTNVMKSQGSFLKGLKEGAKVALAGRSFMGDASFNLHFSVEGRSAAGVKEEIEILKAICERHGGKAIENSIPKIIRANPFGPMNSMIGPQGERWVPVHGLVPLSEAQSTLAEIDDLFEAHAAEIETFDILTGYLLTTIGTTGYLIEPVFVWPEELYALHEQSVEDDYLSKVGRHAPNPDATALVERLRKDVIEIFTQHSGAHFQIGRTYPYKEGRQVEAWALLKAIKSIVDPEGRVNPGSLGLG
ncbi:MAG: FAD-linked oxidase C-terminal domain-containing protein, partial [Pseudomonadota bacterium]